MLSIGGGLTIAHGAGGATSLVISLLDAAHRCFPRKLGDLLGAPLAQALTQSGVGEIPMERAHNFEDILRIHQYSGLSHNLGQ